MNRILDGVFLVVQWALMAFGFLLLVNSLQWYWLLAGTSRSAPLDGDYYVIPVMDRFLMSTIHGVIALGLAGVLYRLRKLYMRRQPNVLP